MDNAYITFAGTNSTTEPAKVLEYPQKILFGRMVVSNLAGVSTIWCEISRTAKI